MFDYSNQESYEIENVDHTINILGVTASAMPWMMWIGLAFFPVNPIVGIFASIVFGLIARKFYKNEQEGRPIEYSKPFQEIANNFPILKQVFPALDRLEQNKGKYRG